MFRRGGRSNQLLSKVLAEPAFVGREQELALLEYHLKLATEGKGTTVFVSGEAGAGKTRFITEFLKRARNKGITTLTGWCLSNAAIPYFPFFEAFNTYFTGEHKSKKNKSEQLEVTTWLVGPGQAEKGGKSHAISPQVWKDQAFVTVAKTLTAISAEKPTIFFIDDVHWADSASLALIHYIARATRSEKILLIVTFRIEELKADAEGRPHPLVETLRLMRREDLIKEIKVNSFNPTGVSQLAMNMLGGELQQELAEMLAEESQGSPLFVVESLRMLHERGGLLQEDKKWRLTSSELGIPVKIKDIILQRLNYLFHNQRKIVDIASVIGEKFNAELLASVIGLNFGEVIETLDVIGKTTSLLSCEGELYRFDHTRTRDTVYEEISPALKKVYHAKVAEQLEKIFKHGKLLYSELAYHYAQAGDKKKAVKYALVAGQDALNRWSNIEAINHFSYVMETIGKSSEYPEERMSAFEGLGDAFYANSMFKESLKIFEELGDTAETGIVKLRALRKAAESAFQHGDAPHLIKIVKKAEPYVAADRLENARILCSRGRAFTIQDNNIAALENTKTALQVFEEEYSLWDIAWASLGIGVSQSVLGMSQESIAAALRSIALFEELGDFRWQMEAYFAAGVTFNMCFLEHEALEMLTKIVEIDKKMKMGDYMRLFHANDFSARSFCQMGDFKNALSFSLEALELSKKTDSIWAHGLVYSDLTIEYAIQGDSKNAEKFFEKLVKLPSKILTHPSLRGVLPKAVLLASKNHWKESNQYFKEYVERFKNRPEPANESFAKLVYSWALERQGCHEEARFQLEESQKIRQKAETEFNHADLQAHLIVRRKVEVGEEFEMRLDLVNIGKKPALLVEVTDMLLNDCNLSSLSSWCSIQEGTIDMKSKEIGAFKIETIKLRIQATKIGVFDLAPSLVYINDLKETVKCKFNQVSITVHKAQPKFEVLPDRIPTGLMELDRLLIGGIPKNHAVVLTGSPCDEKEMIVKNFLKAGTDEEIIFYISTEADGLEDLLHKPNFFLFLCNPKPKIQVPDLPNVYKLQSKTDLTNLGIVLAKAYRSIDQSVDRKRICIEILSDVLMNQGVKTTRKWISDLIADLGAKGFTMLAVMNSTMHPTDQVNAVLDLFDGEINITQSDDPLDCKKSILVKKLRNQDYIKNPICLTKPA